MSVHSILQEAKTNSDLDTWAGVYYGDMSMVLGM